MPRSVQVIPSMPLLGTGKTDYPAAQALLRDEKVHAEEEAAD